MSSQSRLAPVSLEVAFSVVGEQILIPVPRDDEVLHLLAGLDVTLSLAGRDEDSVRWVVRAVGYAELTMVPPRSAGIAHCRSSHPAHGATPESTDTMVISVDRLRGYHETPLDNLRDGLDASSL